MKSQLLKVGNISWELWKSKKLWRVETLSSQYTTTEIEGLSSSETFKKVFLENFHEKSTEEKIRISKGFNSEQVSILVKLACDEFFRCGYVCVNIIEILQYQKSLSSGQLCQILTLYNIDWDDIPENSFDYLHDFVANVLKNNCENSFGPITCFLIDQTETNFITNVWGRSVEDFVPTISLFDQFKNLFKEKENPRLNPTKLRVIKKYEKFFRNLLENFNKRYPLDILRLLSDYVVSFKKIDLVTSLRNIFKVHNPLHEFGYFDKEVLKKLGMKLDADDELVRSCDCGVCKHKVLILCLVEEKMDRYKKFCKLLQESKDLFEEGNYKEALDKIKLSQLYFGYDIYFDLMGEIDVKREVKSIDLKVLKFEILRKLGLKKHALITCYSIMGETVFPRSKYYSQFLLKKDIIKKEVFENKIWYSDFVLKPSLKFVGGEDRMMRNNRSVREITSRKVYQDHLDTFYNDRTEGLVFSDHFLHPCCYDPSNNVLFIAYSNHKVKVYDFEKKKSLGVYHMKKVLKNNITKLFSRGEYFISVNHNHILVINWKTEEKVATVSSNSNCRRVDMLIFDDCLFLVILNPYSLQTYDVGEKKMMEKEIISCEKMTIFENSVFASVAYGIIEFNFNLRTKTLEEKNVFVYNDEIFSQGRTDQSSNGEKLNGNLHVTKKYLIIGFSPFSGQGGIVVFQRETGAVIRCCMNIPNNMKFNKCCGRFCLFSEKNSSNIEIYDLEDECFVHKIRNSHKEPIFLISFVSSQNRFILSEGTQSKKRRNNKNHKPDLQVLSIGRDVSIKVHDFNIAFEEDEKKKNKKKRRKPKKCGGCGIVKIRKMKLCSRCRNVYYCSRKCQIADWKEHKIVCTERDM